jgi:hypothetical protein
MHFYCSTASLHCITPPCHGITPHIAALQHCSAVPPCSTPLHCLTNSSTPFHSISAPLRDPLATSLLCTTASLYHSTTTLYALHCSSAPLHALLPLHHSTAPLHHCLTPPHHYMLFYGSTASLPCITPPCHGITPHIAALHPPAVLHFIA